MGLFLFVFKLSEKPGASVLGVFVYSLLVGTWKQSPAFLEQHESFQPDCVNSVFLGMEKKPIIPDL